MERLWLGAIALGALALRVWNLDQNGWGAEYYSAAVRSMASSAHNFWYCAFDPAGFISVDKPPVALWVQVASVKLFGYSPLALLVPQALEGVGCVLVTYFVVRPRFGALAALLAALFLAVTPVLAAVNRTNNIDSALTLVLLLAAWALLGAMETGKRSGLCLATALVGLAFNTKMLAGFIVLPAFYAAYLVGAPLALRRRVADLALASVVLAAVSLSWIAFFDLTPPQDRPYAGSSGTKNSMLALAVGHNAASRFSLPERPAGKTPAAERNVTAAADDDDEPNEYVMQRLFVRAPTGLLRLAHGQLAAQADWLLPFAFAALVLGFAQRPWLAPLSPQRQSLFFWALWAATYVVVYSFAGGIIHFYYLATLAPAFAVLAGIGAAEAWRRFAEHERLACLLPALLALTALWQLFIEASALGWSFAALATRGTWQPALHAGVVAAVAIAVAGLVLAKRSPRAAGFASLGVAALLALPLAWCLSSVLVPGHGVLPSADLQRLDAKVMDSGDPRVRGTFGRSLDTAPLVDFLRARRSGERFLLATTTTRIAAPIIVATGEPVMAMGGFHGLDIAMTPEELARRVEGRDVRFAMLNDAAAPSRRLGSEAALAPLDAWVRAHGKRIPAARWRSPGMPRGIALYDLRAAD